VLFFTLEQVLKTPFDFKKRGQHLFQNSLFQITLVILNIGFVTLQVYSIDWLNTNNIGLLFFVEIPFWIKLVLSVALYDITTYWIHRASHKVPLFWRLHRVHHSDITMDSSSVFRFHPLELILIYQTGNIITAAIFGTFKELPVEQMNYGLKEFDEDEKQTFLYLMKSPFINIERQKSDFGKGDKEP